MPHRGQQNPQLIMIKELVTQHLCGRTIVEPQRKLAKVITTLVVMVNVHKVIPSGEPSKQITCIQEPTELTYKVKSGLLTPGTVKASPLTWLMVLEIF